MARIRVMIRKFHAKYEVLHIDLYQLTCGQCCKLSKICVLHGFDNRSKRRFCPTDCFKYVSDIIVLEVKNEKRKSSI